MNSDNIKLKTVEETRKEKLENCLPRGVKAMVVGPRVIFVQRLFGHWMPVNAELQADLEKKHIIVE